MSLPMFLSTLCAICAVILIYAEGTVGQKNCHDCIPYIYCKEAKHLADTNKSESSREKFRAAFCGLQKFNNGTKIAKVCCSEFNVPKFDNRGIVEIEHPNIHLLPDSCGDISSDRIIGGVVAGLYEFPWMVVIAYGDDVKFECAGTLINPQYVLTAAHCVAHRDIKGVRVGDFNLKEERDCQGNICERVIQDREVETEIVHSGYNMKTYAHDIALLRLKSPINMTLKNAGIICLPITKDMQTKSITNEQATVTGWGLTEHGKSFTELRKVLIRVRSTEECQEYYSQEFSREHTRFCAGALNKDSCRGDSGGPLMIETIIDNKYQYVQYGVVSTGARRCGSSAPGVYTDVRKYVDWILDHLLD